MIPGHTFGAFKITIVNNNFGLSKIIIVSHKFGRSTVTIVGCDFGLYKNTVVGCKIQPNHKIDSTPLYYTTDTILPGLG